MNWILLLAMLSQLVTDTVVYQSPIVAPRINLVGSGFNGTDPTGPVVLFGHGSPTGFLLGSGSAFRATGGLVDRVRIVRQGTGGTAISFVAASAAERPGEIVIRDVLVCGLSDLAGGTLKDNWDTALLIDGGTLTKTNEAGVRRIRVDHFRAASCLGDSIVLRNVTHFIGTDIQVDRGTANRVPNVVIENSRHVAIYGLNVFGEVHLRGCDQVRFDGYAQVIRVDRACSNINVTVTDPTSVRYERGVKNLTVNGWRMP